MGDELLPSAGDDPDVFHLAYSGDGEFESDGEGEGQFPVKEKVTAKARSRPEAGQGHMPEPEESDESDFDRFFEDALPGDVQDDQPTSCSGSEDEYSDPFYDTEETWTFRGDSEGQESEADDDAEEMYSSAASDWSSGGEERRVLGSGVKIDPKTGIIQDETGDWIAYRNESRRLTYVPFQIRADIKPTVVTIQEPLVFTKAWAYNHNVYTTKIHVTNISNHCVSYMVNPSDTNKFIVVKPHGIIEYGKSVVITVHTSLKTEYTFDDIKNSHIMFYAAPVKISCSSGYTEYGWDKTSERHYLDLWAAYGSAWFPKAEVKKLAGFALQHECYDKEPNFFSTRPYWPHWTTRKLSRIGNYLRSIALDNEDELNFLIFKSFGVVYPDGTNHKELVKNTPYRMSNFEKRVLGLKSSEDYFTTERTMKKLFKLAVALPALYGLIYFLKMENFWSFFLNGMIPGIPEELMGLWRPKAQVIG